MKSEDNNQQLDQPSHTPTRSALSNNYIHVVYLGNEIPSESSENFSSDITFLTLT